MDKQAWELLLKNVDEMKSDIKEVKKEVSTLRIKIATIATVFGILGAYAKTIFFKQ